MPLMRTSMWLFPDRPVEDLVRAAQLMEEAGLDGIWLGDEGVARDPWTALTAIGRATTRLSLGVAISNPYLRHPALTATVAATVAEATGRQVHLGLGPGGRIALAPVGVDLVHPYARMRDGLRLARAVLNARPTDGFEPGAFGWFQPIVDLWVGARGRRISGLASQLADGFFCAVNKNSVERTLTWARMHGPTDVALSVRVVLDEAQREAIRPWVPYGLLDAPPGTCEAAGISRADAERAWDLTSRGDLAGAAALISDQVLASTMVEGPPARASAELADLARRHDVQEITASVDRYDLLRNVERVAPVILAAATDAVAERPAARASEG